MEAVKYMPYYRNSHALVIGIDSYASSSLTTLGSAESDASAIASLLALPKYGFMVNLLLGELATKDAIQKALYALRDSDPDDRLIIYFAGHGYTVTDNFGREKGYLATVDTIPNQEFTALGLDEITNLTRYGQAKHMGFIFDACFSGQALGLTRTSSATADKNIPTALEKLIMRRAYQVVSAGAGDQPVDDFQSMTTLLVNALNGNVHLLKEAITFNNLGLFLQQTMAEDSGKTQIPQFGSIGGSQGGDFVFWAESYKLIGSDNTPSIKPLKSTPVVKKKFLSTTLPEFAAEIDLSGRIEDILSPTVVTISAGLSISIWISGPEKQKAIQGLRRLRPGWGSTRFNVYLYSMLLFYVLKDHIHKLDQVTIDSEYQGYEPQVKSFLLQSFEKLGLVISKHKIIFARLQKNSSAKIMAAKIFKGDTEPDWRITADEVLSKLIKK